MTNVLIRPGAIHDAVGVNAIYNAYVRDSITTFDMVEHQTADREAWFAERVGNLRWPVLVAEAEGRICGFASANPFDPRGAYETSVKTSVFVDSTHIGTGLGTRLYAALFAALETADAHRAYALVSVPNPAPNLASLALHLKFGFAQVAVLNQVGRKFGRYIDVIWLEKRLS